MMFKKFQTILNSITICLNLNWPVGCCFDHCFNSRGILGILLMLVFFTIIDLGLFSNHMNIFVLLFDKVLFCLKFELDFERHLN